MELAGRERCERDAILRFLEISAAHSRDSIASAMRVVDDLAVRPIDRARADAALGAARQRLADHLALAQMLRRADLHPSDESLEGMAEAGGLRAD